MECSVCSKKINPTRTSRKRNTSFYCSPSCYHTTLRQEPKTKTCLVCEKTIVQDKRLSSKRFEKVRFCSLSCFGKDYADSLTGLTKEMSRNWKGGISLDRRRYYNDRRVRASVGGGKHSFEDWENLKKKFNYMCLCCKKFEPNIKLTRDHIIPIKHGGSNYIENIQPLCGSCNSKKHDKIGDEFNYRFLIETYV